MSDVAAGTPAHVPFQRPDAEQPCRRHRPRVPRCRPAGAPPATRSVDGGPERPVSDAIAASGRVASTVVDRLRNNAELRRRPRHHDDRRRGGREDRRHRGPRGARACTTSAATWPGCSPGCASGSGWVTPTTTPTAGSGPAGRPAGHRRVTLVIEYGYVVHTVTDKVRAKVISAVENLLEPRGHRGEHPGRRRARAGRRGRAVVTGGFHVGLSDRSGHRLDSAAMDADEIAAGRARWQARYDAARKRDADFTTLSGIAGRAGLRAARGRRRARLRADRLAGRVPVHPRPLPDRLPRAAPGRSGSSPASATRSRPTSATR